MTLWPSSNAIDDDISTSWRALATSGSQSWIEFKFSTPVLLSNILLYWSGSTTADLASPRLSSLQTKLDVEPNIRNMYEKQGSIHPISPNTLSRWAEVALNGVSIGPLKQIVGSSSPDGTLLPLSNDMDSHGAIAHILDTIRISPNLRQV